MDVTGAGMQKQAEVFVLKDDATTKFKAGQYAEAAKLLTRGLALDANNAILLSNRAAAYQAWGKYAEALTDAESGLSIHPDWAKLHYRKADALHGLQRFSEAIMAWRASHDASDQTGCTSDMFAVGLKRSEDALAAEVEKLKDDATTKFNAGQYAEAAKLLTRGLALDANNAILLSNRAAAYQVWGKYAEALTDAESGLSIHPYRAKLHRRKADALHGLQRFSEAIVAWRASHDASDQTGCTSYMFAVGLKRSEDALAAEVEQGHIAAAIAASLDVSDPVPPLPHYPRYQHNLQSRVSSDGVTALRPLLLAHATLCHKALR